MPDNTIADTDFLFTEATLMQRDTIRINKYLVMCGLGSRRKVEEFIHEGRIECNGTVVKSLATQIDPHTDVVSFDGETLKKSSVSYHIMLNKPKGYLTTISDPFGRPTVMQLLHEKHKRYGVFPVGRLDKDTEGLLLFTNDGDLAHALMHPSFECAKTYSVTLDRALDDKAKEQIEKGLHFREFHAKPCTIVFTSNDLTNLEITIHEGKKRQIRITFAKFQYKVKKLKRISLGPLHLGHLPRGEFRDLTKSEVKRLLAYSQGKEFEEEKPERTTERKSERKTERMTERMTERKSERKPERKPGSAAGPKTRTASRPERKVTAKAGTRTEASKKRSSAHSGALSGNKPAQRAGGDQGPRSGKTDAFPKRAVSGGKSKNPGNRKKF